MKNFVIACCFFVSLNSFGQTPANDPTWQLVFDENFDDLNFWDIFSFYDGGNITSVQLTKNVSVTNGILNLYARTEYTTCPPNMLNTPANNSNYPSLWYGCNATSYNYSGGEVHTKNNNFHYGYYEIKAKMDYASGFWPSFFLLAGDNTPLYAEIDIFEMVGGAKAVVGFNNGTNIPSNNPWNGIETPYLMNYTHMTTNIHGFASEEFPAVNFVSDYRQWHTYGLEWWPNRMVWYVDGIVVRITKNPSGYDNNIPMQVILGTSIRKSIAESVTITPNPDPALYEVDYFRYYQLKGTCSPAISHVCYPYNTHTNDPKLSYDIGNYCYNNTPNDKPYIFRANNYVDIKGEFVVPVGSEVTLDAEAYCAKTNILTGDCGVIIKTCNYNFLGYDNLPKQIIELGGINNCNTTVLPIDNVKLNAKEYIRLSPGFSVPLNSDLEVKILSCQ